MLHKEYWPNRYQQDKQDAKSGKSHVLSSNAARPKRRVNFILGSVSRLFFAPIIFFETGEAKKTFEATSFESVFGLSCIFWLRKSVKMGRESVSVCGWERVCVDLREREREKERE